MSHAGHRMERCRVCGIVVSNCRCMGPKETVLVTCDHCSAKNWSGTDSSTITPAPPRPTDGELEGKLRELCGPGVSQDSQLMSLARLAAAIGRALGREEERKLCVLEATEDWPTDAHWPWPLHDPRSRCPGGRR